MSWSSEGPVFGAVGALVSEVSNEVVTVLAAVAAGPVGAFVAGPVMVCVTPLASTEMVTGTTTTGGSVGWGGWFGWSVGCVSFPRKLFKNCSMVESRLSKSGESEESTESKSAKL